MAKREMAHTIDELKQLQGMPLHIKVMLTKNRIREWVREYGEDGVYVSFSGGKDSTVLLSMVREEYPDIEAVFVNTGLEYPEIVKFVQSIGNVRMIRPKMNFKDVIRKYGYPFPSKEVCENVQGAKRYYEELKASGEVNDMDGLARLLSERMRNKSGGQNQRLAIVLGLFTTDKDDPIKTTEEISGSNKSRFSAEKYKFLLEAPFSVSNQCCNVMKKNPLHEYSKKSGKMPITAQMASESRLRMQKWLENGCNAFESKNPISNPMSFWTEQDVLQYIKEHDIRICSVYGDIVPDMSRECDGQISIWDMGLMEDCRKLCTTGVGRTGCMFCLFGIAQEESPNRFERMKVTHPKMYEWIMKPVDQGGLGYKALIDWINEKGNLNIKY